LNRTDDQLDMKPLTTAQRQYLKGLAHTLGPVVMIGNQGLTPAVHKEIEHSLAAHELIKIKAGSNDAAVRQGWMKEICANADAVEVQQIGKTLVIYRQAKTPGIALPK
jgi:Predicted RNA-binding protein containing KH domain, possibly ribosomal protein